MGLLIVLCVCVATALGIDFEANWQDYKATYKQTFYTAPLECNSAKKTFKANLRWIHEHNRNPRYTYTLGVAAFADLSFEEFKRKYTSDVNLSYMLRSKAARRQGENRRKRTAPPYMIGQHRTLSGEAPDYVDWTGEIPMSPVQDQGALGVCWAYATIGVLEAHIAIRRNYEYTKLSEQELIDCAGMPPDPDLSDDDGEDEGGLHYAAFDYILENGISPAREYPVTFQQRSECNANLRRDVRDYLFGYRFLPLFVGDEEELKKVVGLLGPVVTSISVTRGMQHYSENSGVFADPDCNKQPAHHYVLVVGYGVDRIEGPYWLIKNSWGVGWGNYGYMKLARNRGNMCHVASEAFYPLVQGTIQRGRGV